jgi:hypothetical protein
MTPEALASVVIFLSAQAGILIWVLSRHDSELAALRETAKNLTSRGSDTNHSIGVLEGINERNKEEKS